MLFFAHFTAFGQVDSTSIATEAFPLNCQTQVVLKSSVISPLLEKRGVRLGLEVPIDSFNSLELMTGYYYDYYKHFVLLNKDKMNFDLRLGFKHYFPFSALLGLYTGGGFIYGHSEYVIGFADIRTEVDPQTAKISEFAFVNYNDADLLNSNSFDIVAQLGLQPILYKHLAVDVYVSGGWGLLDERKTFVGADHQLTAPIKTKSNHLLFLIGFNLGYAF